MLWKPGPAAIVFVVFISSLSSLRSVCGADPGGKLLLRLFLHENRY